MRYCRNKRHAIYLYTLWDDIAPEVHVGGYKLIMHVSLPLPAGVDGLKCLVILWNEGSTLNGQQHQIHQGYGGLRIRDCHYMYMVGKTPPVPVSGCSCSESLNHCDKSSSKLFSILVITCSHTVDFYRVQSTIHTL